MTVVDTVKEVSLKPVAATVYEKGEALDLSSIKIQIETASGAKSDVDVTAAMVSGYDANTLGEQTVTVSYGGESFTFKVTVTDEIETISLKSGPTKTEYEYGDELDLAGAKLETETVSGVKNDVDVTAAMVSGYDKNTLGEQTVTVTFRGETFTFKVTVSDVVDDITLVSAPTKTEYAYGDELDLAGAKLGVDLLSGAFEEIDITSDMISGYDAHTEGAQTVTVSYGGLNVAFKVTVTRDPIFVLPQDTKYAEDLPLLIEGETLTVALRDGAEIVSSSNTAVAQVNGTVITAVAFGSSVVTVSDGDQTKTFTVIVKRDYTGKKVTSQSQLSTVRQGVNHMYVYRHDNGDIENDLEAGLNAMTLYEEGGNSWWNEISFIGTDHFGGRGTGAIAFRAPTAGNYTVDYSAWIATNIRHESVPGSGYMTSDETDGFTTGLAKRGADGNITVMLSHTGDKYEVLADETRYHIGTYTADLTRGEELIVFFCSNGYGHSDEVYTDIKFITNSTVNAPLLVTPEFDEKVEDLPKLTVGQSKTLTTRDCATVASSDTSVITVDGNTITAVGYGVAVITVSDNVSGDDESESFAVVVKRTGYDGMTYVTQRNDMSTTTQGVNNLYVYRKDNGDIENALEAGLQDIVLYGEGDAWWNLISFIGNEHFGFGGGGGTAALAFRAPATGSYTVDYSAWLRGDIRTNPAYSGWGNQDGFTTGIAVRKDGKIQVIAANIGDKESVISDTTRYHSKTYTTNLGKGDELIVFVCSNGSPDNDEIKSEIVFITNSTITQEDIYTLSAPSQVEDLPAMTVGQEAALTLRDGASASSDNTDVAVVEDGKIVAKGYGVAVITVSDEYETKSFAVVVKRATYDGLNTTMQSQLSTTTQGVNNLYVYRMDNGDIENDLQNALQNLEPYAEGTEWWNGTSFIGTDHFGGSGTGAIALRASTAGSYTVDYSAWLKTSIRKESESGKDGGGYLNWDVDGFTTGIAKKSADGTITVIYANVGTKVSIASDLTRYQSSSCTVELKAGEELMVFFCSNGNGACDEVWTEIVFISNPAE